MSFHLPSDARRFFGPLLKTHDAGATRFLMFDAYYACLMIGLDARQLGSESELEGEVFTVEYPEAYVPHSDVIAGLLIDAELQRKGIDATDRASVEDEMIKLLNPASATRLSAAGNRLLDLYAAYGTRQILDRMFSPATVEDFLVGYRAFWGPAAEAVAP